MNEGSDDDGRIATSQRWRLSLYRDDSETTVVVNDVKHAFMTCGNTVLTVAAYASDGSHFYINYPRERVCWWKLERTRAQRRTADNGAEGDTHDGKH